MLSIVIWRLFSKTMLSVSKPLSEGVITITRAMGWGVADRIVCNELLFNVARAGVN
jgi:hypothetical protein